MHLCGMDYECFSPRCCKCNSFGCTAAIRCGYACHGPHSDSLYSGSEYSQFNSPRLVNREAGFPNPRRALIGSNQLWRVNDSPYYREFHITNSQVHMNSRKYSLSSMIWSINRIGGRITHLSQSQVRNLAIWPLILILRVGSSVKPVPIFLKEWWYFLTSIVEHLHDRDFQNCTSCAHKCFVVSCALLCSPWLQRLAVVL